MRRHIDIIAYLHIAQSILVLLGAGIVFLIVAGGGLLSGEPTAVAITSTIGLLVSFFLALVALPGFVVAYGLLKRRTWGRIGGLIMGALDLFNFPLGTALGAYTFWALLSDEAQRAFGPSRQRRRTRR